MENNEKKKKQYRIMGIVASFLLAFTVGLVYFGSQKPSDPHENDVINNGNGENEPIVTTTTKVSETIEPEPTGFTCFKGDEEIEYDADSKTFCLALNPKKTDVDYVNEIVRKIRKPSTDNREVLKLDLDKAVKDGSAEFGYIVKESGEYVEDYKYTMYTKGDYNRDRTQSTTRTASSNKSSVTTGKNKPSDNNSNNNGNNGPNFTPPEKLRTVYESTAKALPIGELGNASEYIDPAAISALTGLILEETQDSITIAWNNLDYKLNSSYIDFKGGENNLFYNLNIYDHNYYKIKKANNTLHTGLREISNNFKVAATTQYSRSDYPDIFGLWEGDLIWNQSQPITLSETDIQEMISYAEEEGYATEKSGNLLIFANPQTRAAEGSNEVKNVVVVDTKNVLAFSACRRPNDSTGAVFYLYNGNNRMGTAVTASGNSYSRVSILNYATSERSYGFVQSGANEMGVKYLDYIVSGDRWQ